MIEHFTKLLFLCIVYACVALSNSLLLVFLAVAFYIYLLTVNRELAYELLVLIVLDFVDFIDPEVHGRVENLFKFADLFFLITLFHFALTRLRALKHETKSTHRVTWAVGLLLGFIGFQVIATVIRSGEPLLEALQVARNYSYIVLVVLFANGFTRNEIEVRKKFIILLSTGILLVNSVNFVFGFTGFPPFASYGVWDYGDTIVVKSYLTGVMFVFVIWFYYWGRLLNQSHRTISNYLLLFIFTLGLTTVTFRVLWFGAGIGFVFLLLGKSRQRHLMPKLAGGLLLVVLVFYLTDIGHSSVLKFVVDPISDAYSDVASGAPSLTGRVEADVYRLQAFFASPLLGPGFIHPRFYGLSLGTIDSGYLDLLINFGIVGTILMLALYLVIYRFGSWSNAWACSLRMFVIASVVTLPAAALMSSVSYGYVPLALLYSVSNSE
jgi:hypothetical protein